MTELHGFVPEFLPLYYLVAVVSGSEGGGRGDQRSERFSGGNARDWTNFGHRPKVFTSDIIV